jgi:hypothetical protein
MELQGTAGKAWEERGSQESFSGLTPPKPLKSPNSEKQMKIPESKCKLAKAKKQANAN